MSIVSAILAPLNWSVSVPAPALDRVAAVARIPDERVVAVAERGGVVAAAAVDEVVAVAADERVVALAARDGVVAGAAVDGEADDCGRQGRRTDGVVRRHPLDRQHIVGSFRTIDVHLRRQPADRNRSARTR